MDERTRALERRAKNDPASAEALQRQQCRLLGHLPTPWSSPWDEHHLQREAERTREAISRTRRCGRCRIVETQTFRPLQYGSNPVVRLSTANTAANTDLFWPTDPSDEEVAPSYLPRQEHPTKVRPWKKPGYRKKIKARRKARYAR